MFLPTPSSQEEATFADVVHGWRHDLLVFVHKDLPKLVVILIVAFNLAHIVRFFVNRMRSLADSQSSTSPARASGRPSRAEGTDRENGRQCRECRRCTC